MAKTIFKPGCCFTFILFALFILNAVVFPSFNSTLAAQPSLEVFKPKDKLITEADRLEVKGRCQGIKKLMVNAEVIDILANGEYKAGIVLKPGKNLIKITAFDHSGKKYSRNIRVLRIVTFPDLNKLYKGNPYWAKKAVINLATLALIEGEPSGNFEPKKNVSRGEFATWIARAKGLKVFEPKKDVFFDVPKEHWRAPYIKAVVEKGYMKGIGKDKFGIDDLIIRGDASRIANRAEGLQKLRATKKLGEIPPNQKYSNDIYTSYKASIMKGVSRGALKFEPKRPLNRAEAASLLIKMKRVKYLAKALFDFSKGYDISRLSKVNTVPIIKELNVWPKEAPPDGKTAVGITAEVWDRQGRKDVSLVKVDLRELGGPPDAKLYDDGTFGDVNPSDGVYTLAITIPENVETGRKKIVVTAMDKSGWYNSKETFILVAK